MPDVLTTGSVVAGYRVERLIGRGATGDVYLAADAKGRQVALKVLIPELAHNERFRERFLREARIAASLDEPHVVPALASGEEDGLLYLVMRFVDGLDLREILQREGELGLTYPRYNGAPSYSPDGTKFAFDQDVGDAVPTAHGSSSRMPTAAARTGSRRGSRRRSHTTPMPTGHRTASGLALRAS
jgi:serine/threonine protein kinase